MSEQSPTTDKNKTPLRTRVVAPLAFAAMSLLGTASNAGASTAAPKQEVSSTSYLKAPTPTHASEMEALTGVIQRVDDGKSAKIVDRTLELPGPVGGNVPVRQPIEFKSYGKNFLAFTQDSTPAINSVPAPEAVNDFTIVREPHKDIKDRVEAANLNKDGELVNPTDQSAAYSVPQEQETKSLPPQA